MKNIFELWSQLIHPLTKDELIDPLTNPVFFQNPRVLVTGCFDLFHAGHVHFLKEVYEKYVAGKDRELHIGLSDDTSYAYLKGRKPIYAFEERKAILEALDIVTEVHGFQIWVDVPGGMKGVEDGHRNLLDAVKPVLFVDSNQKPKESIGATPYLKERNIPIKFVDSIDIHTTEILERIKQ